MMQTKSWALAVCAVALSTAAWAEDGTAVVASTPGDQAQPASPAAASSSVAREEGRTSFGAGLRFAPIGQAAFLAGIGATGTEVLLTAIPFPVSPQVTFERKLGDRFALIAGVAGSYTTVNAAPEQADDPYRRTTQAGGFDVLLGARVALSAADAPVELSATAAADAGYVAQSTQTVVPSGALASGAEAAGDILFAGLTLGLAAERRLTEGLSVRLSTSVVSARYSDGFAKTVAGDVEVRANRTALSAGLDFTPALELRLAF